MTYLLDVNVLIALIDPAHVAHDSAHHWFDATGRRNWASCPLTQNGVVRICGQPKYPGSLGSPALVAELMTRLCRMNGHEFWADSVSLLDGDRFEVAELHASAQVTDSYLLGLAVARGGMLATFDRRLSTKAVHGGAAALHVISGV